MQYYQGYRGTAVYRLPDSDLIIFGVKRSVEPRDAYIILVD